MASLTNINRWLVVTGAILVQLCTGSVYSWSVFTKLLVDAGWTRTQTQIILSVELAVFALVMVWSGKKLNTIGPKKLTIISGLMIGTGYILASLFGATNFWTMLLCLGVITGIGLGFGYVVPITIGMRWFPDKKGFITGLTVAGCGLGGLVWIKLASEWGHLLTTYGLEQTLLIYGITFAILIYIGANWMIFPPKNWMLPSKTPVVTSDTPQITTIQYKEYKGREIFSTIQFYIIFLTFIFMSGAGLMTVGLIKLYPMEVLETLGIEKELASTITNNAMAIFFALANVIGRIVWGTISDNIGRRISAILMATMQGLFMISFIKMAGNELLLYIGAACIGFNFGGCFVLFPTITADTFGTKYVGQNYPLIFLGYGIGAIFGPIMGGYLGDLNNFPLAFIICGTLCLISAPLIAMIKPPLLRQSSI